MTNQTQKRRKMQQDEWQEVSDRLIRTFFFKDYDDVTKFVHKVMEIAKKHDHHPNMIVQHDNVKLSICGHDKNKVTEKCHKFALAVDKIK